jgi:DNA-binding CsgD family transcriptional regulator
VTEVRNKIGIGHPSVKTHIRNIYENTRMTYHDDSQ